MKTRPTDIDREAASLFEPSLASLEIRVWFDVDGEPCRLRHDVASPYVGPVVAIDTDDFQTTVVMFDQVEDASRRWLQAASDGWLDIELSWVRRDREKHMAQWHSDCAGAKTSPGAALVKAMQVIRSTST